MLAKETTTRPDCTSEEMALLEQARAPTLRDLRVTSRDLLAAGVAEPDELLNKLSRVCNEAGASKHDDPALGGVAN